MRDKSLQSICIFAFLASGATSAFFAKSVHAELTVIDEDTVLVGGEPLESSSSPLLSRRKREAYTNINGQQVRISCQTRRKVNGECKPFGECYPIFNLREKSLKTERNLEYGADPYENRVGDELQRLYKGVSGPCSDYVLNQIAKAYGSPIPKESYVCCPATSNYTKTNQITRPPANPQGYQNQQCGRFLVERSEAENSTSAELEARIVNGVVAGRGEFPWAVALMVNGRQFCGGSLISPQHVLTAAHCVYFMNRNDVNRLKVQIGDHNIYSNQDGYHQVRGASNVYYHRGFNMRTLYNDVAVIRLASPVSYNNNVRSICLSSNTWNLENRVATVAGWGQVADRGFQSPVLRKVGVRIWRQSECSRTYQGKAPAAITNGMVCAGGNGYDSCKGDSGGPLSVVRGSRAEQIGIVSFGIGCGTYPGVYTRVDQYLDWINKNRR